MVLCFVVCMNCDRNSDDRDVKIEIERKAQLLLLTM